MESIIGRRPFLPLKHAVPLAVCQRLLVLLELAFPNISWLTPPFQGFHSSPNIEFPLKISRWEMGYFPLEWKSICTSRAVTDKWSMLVPGHRRKLFILEEISSDDLVLQDKSHPMEMVFLFRFALPHTFSWPFPTCLVSLTVVMQTSKCLSFWDLTVEQHQVTAVKLLPYSTRGTN